MNSMFLMGVTGFDCSIKEYRRIGKAKTVRIEISRSKKQNKITANDSKFALAA